MIDFRENEVLERNDIVLETFAVILTKMVIREKLRNKRLLLKSSKLQTME